MPRSLIFLGSKQAGLRLCTTLVALLPKGVLQAIVCPDDRQDARSVDSAFEALAVQQGIPFRRVANSAESRAALQEFPAEVGIVHGWYQLLPVGEFVGTAFYGFHYSPLPKYRGNAPLVWQIIQGEPDPGVSFFQLTEGMDEGELVAQGRFPLARDEGIGVALARADELADRMIRDFVPRWLEGRLQLFPQPAETPSYCGMRQPGDGHIDWRQPATRIHDFIRAQAHPYPGAFFFLPDGRKVTVWRSAEESREFMGVPGSVVEVAAEHVVVAAGEGALQLLSVHPEGGFEMAASALLKSLKLRLA